MNDTNALATPEDLGVVPATNNTLAHAYVGLEGEIRKAAQQSLDMAIAGSEDDYTEIEKRSMVTIESLRLVNGLDLTAVLLRGKLVREIEEHGYITTHPAGYNSLEEMASDQGISVSELSKTINLANVVFPYLRERSKNIAELWEAIGKSKFSEMLPHLRVLILEEPSQLAQVNDAVLRIQNDIVASALSAGQERPEPDDVREQAVLRLIEDGTIMNNRQLRQQLRPERTPVVDISIIDSGETRTLLMNLTEDQWRMIERRIGAAGNYQLFVLPENPENRITEAGNIPELRSLMATITGTIDPETATNTAEVVEEVAEVEVAEVDLNFSELDFTES